MKDEAALFCPDGERKKNVGLNLLPVQATVLRGWNLRGGERKLRDILKEEVTLPTQPERAFSHHCLTHPIFLIDCPGLGPLL